MNKHILVVEDDMDGQLLIETMLEHWDFTVQLASHGEDATQKLFEAQEVFDVVIVDLDLPGIDGWQLLHEILHHPSTSHLPCIAITAYHSAKVKNEALNAGFISYLSKPFKHLQLEQALNQAIS